MPQKIVTVVGATGQQGQAVIAAFASNPSYHIRGLTRNPSSPAAAALTTSYPDMELVQADLDDPRSVTSAFAGSHTIFAVTDFYALFRQHGAARAAQLETEQGITMARAALATMDTLEHFIWSTLPASTPEHPVPHFDSKHAVDTFIKQHAALLAKTTFLLVGFYANNLQLASFRPYWIPTVGKYVQFTTYPPETPIPFIGDVRNLTPFVRAIAERAGQEEEEEEEVRKGSVVIAAVATLTAREWVEAWVRERGEGEVQLVRVSRAEYDALFPWPRWAEEFAMMMAFCENVPADQWMEEGTNVLGAEELGVVPAVTMEEWARTWEMPDAAESTI